MHGPGRRGLSTGRYEVSVITPTVGSSYLQRAIQSVQEQTYNNVRHLIVVDGSDHADAVRRLIPAHPRHPIDLLPLPFNTGGGGYNGHRIYGACFFLASSPFVAMLDEDNTFAANRWNLSWAGSNGKG